MTTKRFLLDLIEVREARLRSSYPKRHPQSTFTDEEHEEKLRQCERARRLVEKGPDEP
jgi:hypothetical protein